MRYTKNLYDLFDNFDFEAQAIEVGMFNKENELVDYLEPYLSSKNTFCRIYVDGELFGVDVGDTSYLFHVLRALGFGKDYTITWSFYTYEEGLLEYGVIEIITQ